MKKRSLYAKRSTLNATTADLLLEIGTEELPAAYLPSAIEQLRLEAERMFREAHVACTLAETFGTPRRLILIARALDAIQRNPAEEIRGPSKQAAYDASGKPTGALLGFLKSKGGMLTQTNVVPTDKGEYVYMVKPARNVSTVSILPKLLPQLIARIRFPKTTRWDNSGVRFARPIRWLVASYGNTLVRLTLGRLTSGRTTCVGGPTRPKAVATRDAAQYLKTLTQHGIVWDHRVRRQQIEKSVLQMAQREQGRPAPETISYGLLDEVTFLVERPIPMLGQFDKKYLSLPREVLLASMAKHQRVFALEDRHGKLLPKFVAILDGQPRKLEAVRRVHEHILNARLADSLLFWEQDRKRPLSQADVSGVTFHEKLGSMKYKSARLHILSAVLKRAWNLSAEEFSHLRRACELAKSDLVSTMVKEFPTLQGVMGKYYAQSSGEPQPVCEALEEQYLPQAGRLPKTLIGSALGLLDKFDTLASYFSLGIEPTGDQDPFGLRRAAQGLIEISWALQRPLPLAALLDARVQIADIPEIAQAVPRIQRYVFERLYNFDWPKPAPSRDLIEAVLASPGDDPIDAIHRVRNLQQLNGNQTLLKAAKVIERTHNILKASSAHPTTVDPARFQEPLERQLWERYQTHEEPIRRLIERKAYAEATTLYGETFFDILHEFFARVLVNVQDPAIQHNRLALMRTINALYTDRIADLSKLTMLQLQGEGS